MSTNQTTCKNCETPFESEYDFCPHCGQKSKDELTIGVLFYNTISNYFSFDARFFKSFIPLLTKPGYLASKFIEGKRLLYLHPAQMYLFISVIFFFLFTILVRPQTEKFDKQFKKTLDKPLINDSIIKKSNMDTLDVENLLKPLKDNQKVIGMNDAELKALDSVIKNDVNKSSNNINFDFDQKKVDSLIKIEATDQEIYEAMGLEKDDSKFTRRLYAQMLKFYKKRDGGSLLKAFYDSIPLAMFILLPIFALLLKIFYWKRGTFAHHLVFAFYFFSYLFMLFSIIIAINFIWDIPDWIDWLIIWSSFFYLYLALKRFYQQGWFVSFIKCSVVSFTFLLMVLPFAAIIVGFATFMFY
ncbi:DUF3667 domain-containing protein [Formosa maritima]|uniref:DUF3667 domain-containing protein n=1 Tax=Formosa maritima TaxID=2592046 RepID=A0A5D0GJ89_9FLAO|nr:DUF3667 domain-containing protein [Formosa maritima]TYA59095.1 DUF3667 domain-containing protein [Formosa maritima]